MPTDPRGRDPIAVSQPVGSGWYPFINPSDNLEQLLGDAYLAYTDEHCGWTLPFRVRWLYGFGSGSPAVDVSPVHAHEILIEDADGETVFDSRQGSYQVTAWGDRLQIIQWETSTAVLRVVQHTLWGPDDTPIAFANYIAPTRGVLDARTCHRRPRRVTSLRIGLDQVSGQNLRWENGYNTALTLTPAVAADGARVQNFLQVDVAPGLGKGRYGDGCADSELDPPIRRLNNATANDRGAFVLDAGGCYRWDRPVLSSTNDGGQREARVRASALQFVGTCGPKCDCNDYIAVYEGIRRLRDRLASLVVRKQNVIDLYQANRSRFIRQADCRRNNRLRAVVQPFCPCELAIAAAYCNFSDQCLQDVVLHLSFEYTDVTNCIGESGGIVVAASQVPATPEVRCNASFRGGNRDPEKRKARTLANRQPYTVQGEWPHYWAHWDLVDPGAMAYVTFRLKFAGCQTTDNVEMVVDAYALQGDPPATGSGVSPVPGYVLGSGPVSNQAQSYRLMDCPIQVAAGLLPAGEDSCCT